jgi:hypothetical protein
MQGPRSSCPCSCGEGVKRPFAGLVMVAFVGIKAAGDQNYQPQRLHRWGWQQAAHRRPTEESARLTPPGAPSWATLNRPAWGW